MYKVINSDPLFEDIRSDKSRYNFDLMVNYLCSKLVPDVLESPIELTGRSLEEYHEYLSNILYSNDNRYLADSIVQTRSKIDDTDMIDGYSYIYELDRKIILELDSRKYFVSVAVLEHELIHLIQAINNNNPKTQYNEFLSIFGEMLSLELLSNENLDTYKNSIVRRFINRMSYRVFTSNFEDGFLEKQPEFIRRLRFSSYPYMLGFIYSIRLLDLYHSSPNEVLEKFNCVLCGKKSVDELLTDDNISLEDEATVMSFKKMCDLYEEFVIEKYGVSKLHHTR